MPGASWAVEVQPGNYVQSGKKSVAGQKVVGVSRQADVRSIEVNKTEQPFMSDLAILHEAD